jgi:hypothetical protein
MKNLVVGVQFPPRDTVSRSVPGVFLLAARSEFA